MARKQNFAKLYEQEVQKRRMVELELSGLRSYFSNRLDQAVTEAVSNSLLRGEDNRTAFQRAAALVRRRLSHIKRKCCPQWSKDLLTGPGRRRLEAWIGRKFSRRDGLLLSDMLECSEQDFNKYRDAIRANPSAFHKFMGE